MGRDVSVGMSLILLMSTSFSVALGIPAVGDAENVLTVYHAK